MTRRCALLSAIAVSLIAGITGVCADAGVAQGNCAWVDNRWRCTAAAPAESLTPDPDGPPVEIRATLQVLDDVALGFGNVGDPAPCILGSLELDPAGQGFLYLRESFSVANGVRLDWHFACIGPGEPPAPPPLPTRAEIWQATPVPPPVIHVSPHIDGLVGLDTWLWGDPHGAVTINLSLRGWAVSGTAAPSEWIFETSDGGYYEADNPGSEETPVGNHLFSRHGTYGISHTVSWNGGFVVSGYGFSFEVDGLARSFNAERDYDVIEIEAVIRPAGGDGD